MSGAVPLTHEQTMHAAAMAARGVSAREIGEQLGVGNRRIRAWLKSPAAVQHIAEIRKGVSEGTKHLAVADKVRRIVMAQREVDRIMDLIRLRAVGHPDVPESRTGLIALKVTTNTISRRDGSSLETRTVESRYDAALHQQLRSWMEYVAKEKGELEADASGKYGAITDVAHMPDLTILTDEERRLLTETYLRVMGQEWKAQ